MESKKAFVGRWRIVQTELWDPEDLDCVGPAHLLLKRDGLGELSFIAVNADVDYRVVRRDGVPAIEFSFQGFDEGEEVAGRGWALLNGQELRGRLFFHRGDDSGFVARRVR